MTDLTPHLTDSQLFTAARNMERMGGSFAASIAQAYFVADTCNRIRLLAAFGDMFERFAPTQTTQGETS